MKYILTAILATISFLYAPEAHAADKFTVQIGSYKAEQRAHDVIDKLEEEGHSCEIHQVEGLNKVYCGSFDSKEEASALRVSLKKNGYSGAFVTTGVSEESEESGGESSNGSPDMGVPPVITPPAGAAMDASVEIAAEGSEMGDIATSESSVEETDSGEGAPSSSSLAAEVEAREGMFQATQGTISGDVFEAEGRYIHPFISVTGVYTDNVFNTNEDVDAEDDYIYIISPGFWATVPPTGIEPALTELSVGSPGGARLTRLEAIANRKINGHLYYRGDAEEYWDNHSEDIVNHTAEGQISYNTLNGIYIALADQYVRSHEDRGTTLDNEKNLYTTNRVDGTLILGQGRKASLDLGGTAYTVNYEENDLNDYRERTDKKARGYVYIQIQPKTSLFAGAEYAVVDYKKNVLLPDSKEIGYFAGITWNISGRTTGILKGGQTVKKFVGDDFDLDDERTSSGEAQIIYAATAKTKISIAGSRAFKESNMQTSPFVISQTGRLALAHRLSSKISASLGATYIKDDYDGEVLIDGEVGERSDKTTIGTVALKWDVTHWNSISIGYIYKKRDSNFDILDYKANMGFLRLSATL